jgi:hypothetical protein
MPTYNYIHRYEHNTGQTTNVYLCVKCNKCFLRVKQQVLPLCETSSASLCEVERAYLCERESSYLCGTKNS